MSTFVFVPPQALFVWMRHDTLYACQTDPDYLPEWELYPEAVGAVARGGTQQALTYLSSRYLEKFQLHYTDTNDLIEAIHQGLYLDLNALRSILYLAYRTEYHDRPPGFGFSLEDVTDEQYLENVVEDHNNSVYEEYEIDLDEEGVYLPNDEALRALVPMARAIVPPCVCDLARFVKRLTPLLCQPQGPHFAALRPVLTQVLDTMVERGFPFDEPDRAGQTLVQYIAQWRQPDLDALFAPPCGLK